jgi:acyl-CoA synthetase (AMP-forming)/AMP-acid ligase II
MVFLQPNSILVYPHVASWLAKQNEELKMLKEANFLQCIVVGGWVLDTASADALFEALPNTFLQQMYGMTENFCSSLSKVEAVPQKIQQCIQEGNIGIKEKPLHLYVYSTYIFLQSHINSYSFLALMYFFILQAKSTLHQELYYPILKEK